MRPTPWLISPSSLIHADPSLTVQDWLQVVKSDIDYMDRQGVPVTSLIRSVAETHNQVAAALNPTLNPRRLEDEIRFLQAELERAHAETHESERRLGETLGSINALENTVRTLSTPATERASSGDAASSSPSAAAAAAATLPAPAPAPTSPRPSRAKRAPEASRPRGIRGTLEIPPKLKDHWFPVEFSKSLKEGELKHVELFGADWVLWRDQEGRPACVRDACAHRSCPLSVGSVQDGQAVCSYHGWKHDRSGLVTDTPSTRLCAEVQVDALPVHEAQGFVWIWTGEGAPDKAPSTITPPPGYTVHSELVIEVPVEHGLMIENLLDLAHAPFTHQGTFAKGWPVPDVVKFHAEQALHGFWHPYPIDMAFRPPCMTISHIGLAKPGQVAQGARAQDCKTHLWQLHVCLPSSDGKCRVLYRMAMDFMPWLKHVPLIDRLWSSVADQVMGEDMKLVIGQQDRVRKGADMWRTPVQYDSIGVRYRRWRNSLEDNDPTETRRLEKELAENTHAGSLFALLEGQDPRL